MRTCSNCAYSDIDVCDEHHEPLLLCKRYPPQLVVFEGQMAQTFINVTAENWCGEWHDREEDR